MKNKERKIYIGIAGNITINLLKRKWKCLVDGCEENSINSHLLQRNGILNSIAENGHLIEIKLTDIFKFKANQTPISFNFVGVKKAFTKPVFCAKHDSEIFKEIENEYINFESYKTFILLSYRVTLAELRKKEFAVERQNRLINSQTLKGILNEGIHKNQIKDYKLGIEDLKVSKKHLESEINSPQENFVFIKLEFPYLETYASALFNVTNYPALDNVFIHIIPHSNKLIVIIGYYKKHTNIWIKNYIESWKNLESKNLGEKLTELFVNHIENWGISPKIYKTIDDNLKKQFIDNYMNYLNPKYPKHKIDLFKNVT